MIEIVYCVPNAILVIDLYFKVISMAINVLFIFIKKKVVFLHYKKLAILRH